MVIVMFCLSIDNRFDGIVKFWNCTNHLVGCTFELD